VTRLVCSEELRSAIKTPQAGSGCFKAVKVKASRPSTDPHNFLEGVALCMADVGRASSFLYNCLLMTMRTMDNNRYVRSLISPPLNEGGGGAFVDSFGSFSLTCKFPTGETRQRLSQIKTVFQVDGLYQIDGSIRIMAYSTFQLFKDVGLFGRFKMAASDPNPQTDSLSIKFAGKWWNQNREDRSMPVFEDEDVYQFKRMFDSTIGGTDACSVKSAFDPRRDDLSKYLLDR
jgi:hypothetical protein